MELDDLSTEELTRTLAARDDLTEIELVLLDRLLRVLDAMPA